MTTARAYVGQRIDGEAYVDLVELGQPRPLPLRLEIRNHSPTGFEWGYGGSGPAQLALAILCDAIGVGERAERLYQSFKFRVIANLPRDGFELPLADVLAHVARLEAEDRA